MANLVSNLKTFFNSPNNSAENRDTSKKSKKRIPRVRFPSDVVTRADQIGDVAGKDRVVRKSSKRRRRSIRDTRAIMNAQKYGSSRMNNVLDKNTLISERKLRASELYLPLDLVDDRDRESCCYSCLLGGSSGPDGLKHNSKEDHLTYDFQKHTEYFFNAFDMVIEYIEGNSKTVDVGLKFFAFPKDIVLAQMSEILESEVDEDLANIKKLKPVNILSAQIWLSTFAIIELFGSRNQETRPATSSSDIIEILKLFADVDSNVEILTTDLITFSIQVYSTMNEIVNTLNHLAKKLDVKEKVSGPEKYSRGMGLGKIRRVSKNEVSSNLSIMIKIKNSLSISSVATVDPLLVPSPLVDLSQENVHPADGNILSKQVLFDVQTQTPQNMEDFDAGAQKESENKDDNMDIIVKTKWEQLSSLPNDESLNILKTLISEVQSALKLVSTQFRFLSEDLLSGKFEEGDPRFISCLKALEGIVSYFNNSKETPVIYLAKLKDVMKELLSDCKLLVESVYEFLDKIMELRDVIQVCFIYLEECMEKYYIDIYMEEYLPHKKKSKLKLKQKLKLLCLPSNRQRQKIKDNKDTSTSNKDKDKNIIQVPHYDPEDFLNIPYCRTLKDNSLDLTTLNLELILKTSAEIYENSEYAEKVQQVISSNSIVSSSSNKNKTT